MTDVPSIAPSVSVIIPTVGRDSLRESLASVRAQVGAGSVRSIVVFDTAAEPEPAWSDEADIVLWTGGGKGGGVARQQGVDASTTDYVAFLDDDDAWDERKIALQLAAAESALGGPRLVGCRLFESEAPDGSSKPTPTQVCTQDETLVDYLFVRRGPTVGRHGIPTSTLLVDRHTATELVRWDPELRRHQDWDWLRRFDELPARTFVHLPDALVRKTMGSDASISASADWRASLAWYEQASDRWSARSRSDFLAGQVLRYALQSRSIAGVTAAVRAVAATRRLPSFSSLALGLVGLVPRSTAQAAFSSLASKKQLPDRSDPGA